MRAIFFSDVHLKRRSDSRYQNCLQLLEQVRGMGDAGGGAIDLLVIAGDFFDFWFEKGGRIYPEFEPIVEGLAGLKRSGIRVCLCEGNHDFFLADFFWRRLGIEVYPQDAEFLLDSQRILVSHGDTVDRKNYRYLALRRFLRSPFSYWVQRGLPLEWLWRIARFASVVSKDRFGSDADGNRLNTVMHRFAVERFREGFDAVIFGHSHTPSFREEWIGGRRTVFATLGDWLSHGRYLVYEDGRFTLTRFPPRG